MQDINEKYKRFEDQSKLAEAGGGADRREKQHREGKLTARERIHIFLDAGTFVEMDKFVTHTCTNFGMDKSIIPGDGIVTGYGKVDRITSYNVCYTKLLRRH